MKKILVFWRDIPAQVIVQRGRARTKEQLSHRFQEAIDRAAMRAGKGSTNAYIAEWRREAQALDGALNPEEIVAAEVARLESEYSDERLLSLIRNHGAE